MASNSVTSKRLPLICNDWHSPAEIVWAARIVMGAIDLAPASNQIANGTVGAARYYSPKEDGLTQPWSGRVWLNPPYGKHAPKFVKRFTEFFAAGRITQGILLLDARHLTTRWIGPLLDHHPIAIACYPWTRPRFSGSTQNPAHASVILGVGVDQEAFEREFSHFGYISYF